MPGTGFLSWAWGSPRSSVPPSSALLPSSPSHPQPHIILELSKVKARIPHIQLGDWGGQTAYLARESIDLRLCPNQISILEHSELGLCTLSPLVLHHRWSRGLRNHISQKEPVQVTTSLGEEGWITKCSLYMRVWLSLGLSDIFQPSSSQTLLIHTFKSQFQFSSIVTTPAILA